MAFTIAEINRRHRLRHPMTEEQREAHKASCKRRYQKNKARYIALSRERRLRLKDDPNFRAQCAKYTREYRRRHPEDLQRKRIDNKKNRDNLSDWYIKYNLNKMLGKELVNSLDKEQIKQLTILKRQGILAFRQTRKNNEKDTRILSKPTVPANCPQRNEPSVKVLVKGQARRTRKPAHAGVLA
jgi:hypothetical protein